MRRAEPVSRFVSRRAGLVVLVATVIFFAAVLQAGVLRDLFSAELELRVILPESGLQGLQRGARVDVLGTQAGEVKEIVLDPEAGFHALVSIDKSMQPFLAVDSRVFIRKQFGIAGAAYLEITRGSGHPLDWDYAVLTAESEVAPTASAGELIEDVRTTVLPMLADLRQTIRAVGTLVDSLADPEGKVQRAIGDVSMVTGRIAAGEGNVGRLLQDERIAVELEAAVAELRRTADSVSVVVANLRQVTGDVAGMTAGLAAESGKLPAMLDNTNATLRSLNQVVAEVGRSMPAVTQLLRDSAEASGTLPGLLAQTQHTLAALQDLLAQLQGSWLLGGGASTGPDRVDRLSPVEARP